MTRKAFGIATLVALFTGGERRNSVLAHHAFSAEFDQSKPVKISGEITKLEWVNPHAWLFIDVKGADGKVDAVAVRDGRAERAAARRLVEERHQGRHAGDHQRIHGALGRLGRQRIPGPVARRPGSVCGLVAQGRQPASSSYPTKGVTREKARRCHRCGRRRGDQCVADAAARAAGRRVGAARANAAARSRRTCPSEPAAIKRLPDGTPDIRGTWVRVGGGMNEANAPDSELKAFGVLSEPQGFGQGLVTAGPEGGIAQAQAAEVPAEPASAARDRRSGEPPAAVHARRRAPSGWTTPRTCAARRSRLSYLELSVRCAPPQPWAGGGVHIFQKPGEIALLFEQNHQTRIFYTDGRAHPSPDVVFFGGHSTATLGRQ